MHPTRLALALRRALIHLFGNWMIKMFYKTASLIFPGILYDKSKKFKKLKFDHSNSLKVCCWEKKTNVYTTDQKEIG